MQGDDARLYRFLIDSGIVDRQALDAAAAVAQRTKQPFPDVLVAQGVLTPVQLQKARATILGVPFVDLTNQRIPLETLSLIPEALARKHHIVAFARTPSELRVALQDPEDLQAVDFVRKKTGLRVLPCLATPDGIAAALRQYNKSLQAEFGDIIAQDAAAAAQVEEDADLSKVAEDLPVVRIVDRV